MTFAIGVFDLLTYAIPGSFYLGFLSYVAARMHWVDFEAVGRTPVFLLVVVIILLSYLLGFLAYPLGALLNRAVPRRRERRPRQEFLRRVPAAKDRLFVKEDPFLLLAALQLHDKDLAVEVTRLRASGLMLRNTAPPLVLGLVAAIVELFVGRTPALVSACAVLLAAGCVALIIQARRLGYYASMKTLELCFWLSDVDEKFNTALPAPRTGNPG